MTVTGGRIKQFDQLIRKRAAELIGVDQDERRRFQVHIQAKGLPHRYRQIRCCRHISFETVQSMLPPEVIEVILPSTIQLSVVG